jgi:hypothetical protein
MLAVIALVVAGCGGVAVTESMPSGGGGVNTHADASAMSSTDDGSPCKSDADCDALSSCLARPAGGTTITFCGQRDQLACQ